MDTSLSRESARPTHLRPRRRRLTDYKVRTPRMPPGPALKYGKRKAAGSRTPAAAPSPSNMPPEPAWPKPYGFIRDGTSRRCARVPCRALRLRSARRAINAAPRGLDARHRLVGPRPHGALTVCESLGFCGVCLTPHAAGLFFQLERRGRRHHEGSCVVSLAERSGLVIVVGDAR
jgi:hypothetical protein